MPAATAGLLAKLRAELPALRAVVVTDAADGVVPRRHRAAPRGAGRRARPPPPEHRRPTPAPSPACSSPPGPPAAPGGVLLTHRNIVANAKQIALAHRLDTGSVTLNHLPLYHVMHLNSGLYAGACQVRARTPDPVASLAVAAEAGATHYYGLPARLHALAHDGRLAGAVHPDRSSPPSCPAVRRSPRRRRPRCANGSACPSSRATAWPNSPRSPTASSPTATAPGMVGGVVPGTECRLVDLTTRRPRRRLVDRRGPGQGGRR